MRLLPDEPLPPYSYVPGFFPHPFSDPAGHHWIGNVEWANEPFEMSHLANSPRYLYALDLFNAGFYWEAHEAWEVLWRAAGRTGTDADFFKGLIKLAAAAVKSREGNAAGVRRHAVRAAERFEQVQAAQPNAPTRFGLELAELHGLAQKLAGPLADQSDAPFPTRNLPLEISFRP